MREEAREAASAARRDLELERDAREALERELGVDREKAANLQSVLEDFQAGMLCVMLILTSVDVTLFCSSRSRASAGSQGLRL